MKNVLLKLLHIVMIITIVLMSGCGLFRKVSKSKEYNKIEIKSTVKKDSVVKIIDKSTITVKEKIDTLITVPESRVSQDTYIVMDSLVNGMTAIKNDLVDVRLSLNPVTGILSAQATLKPRKIPAILDRTITKQNDIASSTNVSTEEEHKAKTASGSSHIEKQPVSTTVLVFGGFVLLVALLAYWYWKGGRK